MGDAPKTTWFRLPTVRQVFTTLVLTVPIKLIENAWTGWIDNQIGEYFSLGSPSIGTVLSFVWNWLVPLAIAVAVLSIHHAYAKREWQKKIGGAVVVGIDTHLKKQLLMPIALTVVTGLLFSASIFWLYRSLNTSVAVVEAETDKKASNPDVQLRKETPVHPGLSASKPTSRDPDSVFQFGNKVGTVVAAEVDLSSSTISFEKIEGAADFDIAKQFEYREYLLKLRSIAAETSANLAGLRARTLHAVVAQIIEREAPAPQHVSTVKPYLLARARFLYDRRSQSMAVISKQDVEIVTIDRDTSVTAMLAGTFIARFAFPENTGPYDITVTDSTSSDFSIGLPISAVVIDNEKNFVKLRFAPSLTAMAIQNTAEITVSFYRKTQ